MLIFVMFVAFVCMLIQACGVLILAGAYCADAVDNLSDTFGRVLAVVGIVNTIALLSFMGLK